MTLYNGADLTFTSLSAPSGWSFSGISAPNDSIEAAGVTSANVLRLAFPAGLTDGQIAIIETSDIASGLANALGMGATIRPSADFVQHVSGVKIFYPYAYNTSVDGEGRPFELRMKPVGAANSGLYTLETESYVGGGVRTANLADTQYSINQMTQVLLYAKFGSTPDAADGILRWWTRRYVAGAWTAWEQNANYTNYKVGASDMTGFWKRPQFNIYFGGGAGTPLPATQYLDTDRIRVSYAVV